MLNRQIRGYWAAITGVATFAVGIAGTLGTLWLAHDKQNSELNDRERDFVLKIMEMQNTNDAGKAKANAGLTAVVARHYLHDPAFADAFISTVSQQSVAIGADAGQAANDAKTQQGQAPEIGGAARAVSEVSSAVGVANSIQAGGAPTPSSVQAVIAPSKGRVFFQYTEATQLGLSQNIRAQLQPILGGGWSVLGDERVRNFDGRAQVRYFYPADKADANRVATILQAAFPAVSCQRISGYDAQSRVKPRLLEVWIGPRDSAAGSLRPVAAAKDICS